MPFAPRSHEVAAVESILESEEFDSARQMARAIVSAVAAEIARREAYAVFPDSGVAGYGIFFSAKDAERAWLRQGIGAAYGGHRGRLLTLRPWTEETESALRPCGTCGHKPDQHSDRGGCAVFGLDLTGPKAKKKPYWPQCACGSYRKEVQQ